MLANISKHKKTAMCLAEKIYVREIFLSEMNYSYGCNAMISMPIHQQYIVNKAYLSRNTHTTRLCIDQLTKIL